MGPFHISRSRGAFSLLEGLALLASVVVAGRLGVSAHQWMWERAQLSNYRATMQDIATTLRATHVKTVAQHQIFELRVDPSERQLQFLVMSKRPRDRVERIERTIWLPDGLEIRDAPRAFRASPTGRLFSATILVLAPAYNRTFRLQTTEAGEVQLYEESTL